MPTPKVRSDTSESVVIYEVRVILLAHITQFYVANLSVSYLFFHLGGMAALHLYNYYWSCIDYPSTGSRSIQSVGTPYRGTSLAGSLAAIGEIFDNGCGYNYDLTESGADRWLRSMRPWARAKVNYYTTAFKDNWWSYDYCHLATDSFLDDPDDGVVEKGRGQLSGGNNRGHKSGQCHSSGMYHGPQYNDRSRNNQMNSYAMY